MIYDTNNKSNCMYSDIGIIFICAYMCCRDLCIFDFLSVCQFEMPRYISACSSLKEPSTVRLQGTQLGRLGRLGWCDLVGSGKLVAAGQSMRSMRWAVSKTCLILFIKTKKLLVKMIHLHGAYAQKVCLKMFDQFSESCVMLCVCARQPLFLRDTCLLYFHQQLQTKQGDQAWSKEARSLAVRPHNHVPAWKRLFNLSNLFYPRAQAVSRSIEVVHECSQKYLLRTLHFYIFFPLSAWWTRHLPADTWNLLIHLSSVCVCVSHIKWLFRLLQPHLFCTNFSKGSKQLRKAATDTHLQKFMSCFRSFCLWQSSPSFFPESKRSEVCDTAMTSGNFGTMAAWKRLCEKWRKGCGYTRHACIIQGIARIQTIFK